MFRLGYQLAIYPATGFLAMGQALNKVYRNLSETGDLEFQPTDHGILVMIQWVVWRKWEEDLQCWLICFKWLIFMKFLLGYFGGKRGVSNIFVAGVLESDGGCWYIGILPTLFWFHDVFLMVVFNDWCNTCFFSCIAASSSRLVVEHTHPVKHALQGVAGGWFDCFCAHNHHDISGLEVWGASFACIIRMNFSSLE